MPKKREGSRLDGRTRKITLRENSKSSKRKPTCVPSSYMKKSGLLLLKTSPSVLVHRESHIHQGLAIEMYSERKIPCENYSYHFRHFVRRPTDQIIRKLSVFQFCRLAYELMNSIRNDAWSRISSLDNDFYYAYVLQHERQAAEPYEDGVYTSEIRDTYR